uniref:PKD domain-containing protein n=1 Tax=Pseudotamlana agarivorans TaxID=481183 RepID=UPI00082F6C04
MSFCYKTIVVGFLVLISHQVSLSQSINFGASGLVGANINNPTSLDFGPNNKLYVAQQDGVIWEYEVSRGEEGPGNGTYTILNSNQITLIKENTPNHNDDGTNNSTKKRQITGLLTAGTNTNPILYVTSSDSRIGGGGGAGNDVNLDTNSGILSRLRWNGSTWEKVDLVRGLPRCEENHSTNGLDLFTRGGITYLLIQQGGNTNQGAPSNNFAGSTEFYLAGALLIVNISQLEQMETANGGPYLDSRTNNTPFIYDLPSLNDPDKLDIDNTHPSFPYSASHPLYNATIDLGDPFGGNNGLNQTFPENGGPVQIFSPGYRNAFDVVVTTDGRIFTGDNGPNGGWGGTPLIYDSNNQLKGTHNTATYNSAAGDYITNKFNIENGKTHGDALHYVGTINDPNNTYYGGHPVPIRAFPDKAGVYKFQYDGNSWIENGAYDWSALISGVRGYFNTEFTMADFPSDVRQGEYLADALSSPKVNILDIVGSSTNGLCEYTASNFDGAMQGNILTASFNGSINRYSLDASGTTLLSKDNGFLSGFGNIPLDLIAMGDNSIFPGTIWVVTYGADDVTVFEPGDFGDCFQPGDSEYDGMADYDGDGFTNDDEINNGTNHCSAGSSPSDNDGDFLSDLADTDDDNDGIPDNQDVFSIDPQNGLASNLPILYPFWNNDPGTGFFGLGFTGLMTDPTGTINYLSQYDEVNLSFGGAGGKATVDAVSSGDALGSQNSQENAFQFGVNVDENSNPFTVHCKVATPFNGAAPIAGQSYGVYIGNGDQDNYLKVALMEGVTSGDNIYGFEIVNEINGVNNTTTFDAPELLQAAGVDLYINVNPETNSARVFYSLNSGLDIVQLGSEQQLAASFLSASDNKGMAVGIIGTSGSSNSTYIATWDFINVTEDQSSTLQPNPDTLDFESLVINSSAVELNLEISNEGSPANGAIEVSGINFSGVDANLFTSTLSLPLSVGPGSEILVPVKFTPDENSGTKSATLEITHSGINSPLVVPLNATLSEPLLGPLVRISAGSSATITSTDSGPDWESNPSNGAYNGISYSVNTGTKYASSLPYSNRHSSIPGYIDENTFNGLFNSERWDADTEPEMDFSIPISNGQYTVNLFLGNSYSGTNKVGNRVFDILIEGVVVEDNLDLITTFGHQVAGMLSYPVTVNDGVLNISFGHEVENPLINGIEIISGAIISNQPPVAVASASSLTGASSLEVSFTGSESSDDKLGMTYFWDFGDGNTGTSSNPVHTYTVEGNYTVTLTVTDSDGLQDSAQLSIDVTGNQSQTITFEPISDQYTQIGGTSSLVLFASGGDPNENVTYQISNQPEGIDIEPTNGHIIGSIDPIALNGGPNNDGVHLVTVTASKPGSQDVTLQFSWTVTDDSTKLWIDKNEDETYTARHECSFVQAGDKFYMFGGRENAKTLDVYDYTTNSWNSLTNSAPIEFNHFQAVEYQGLIWVIGAFKTNVFPTETPADYIWAFNPANQEWIQGPEIPEGRKRGSTGLVVYDDKFYILAGNTRGHDGGYVDWFDEYDPATGIWTVLENAPRPRDHFHAAVINGKLYAASGRLSGGSGGVFGPVIPEVDVYDFSSQTWSTLPSDQNIPTGRAAAIVANFENKLVVAGGETPSSSTALKTTEIYDPNLQSWTTGEDLNHHRHGTQGIVSGRGIFTAGGSPSKGGGNQKNMECYGVDSPEGSPSVASSLISESNLEIPVSGANNFMLDVSNGNIGIMIKSLDITGSDASEFDIVSGDLSYSILKPNSQHQVTVQHLGTETNKSALLTIVYDNNSSKTLNLNVGSSCKADFVEANGVVIIEAENLPLPSGWHVENNTTGFSGSGYINWTGGEYFSSPGHGTISSTIKINTPGTYLLEWRSKIGEGSSNTDNNDTWLRFNDASEFYAKKGSNIIYPKGSGQSPLVNGSGSNNWFKVYSNNLAWNWQSYTNDNDPHAIYVDFDSPGIYTMEISGRSEGHFIDRIVLSASGNRNLALEETLCGGNQGNQAPIALASATVLSGEAPLEVSFTGSDSTDDSGIVTYHWDFGDGNTATTADPVHTFVSEGIYTVRLTIEDAEGLQNSQELSIEVTPDLPAALIANEEALDFGSRTINGSASQLNLELFNNGDIGEDISISSISITGTDAILFGHSEALPLTVNGQSTEILAISFTPDGNIGTKSASIEITHSGENSPIIVP